MSAVASRTPEQTGWDSSWERNVYARGRQLNRYPYPSVVGFVFKYFSRVEDPSSVRILELGFGAGNNVWFAAREGFSVCGMEGSPTAAEYARNRLAGEGMLADLRVGDFATLPWPDESVDAVVDRIALSHCTKSVIQRALGECHRVLKPGGKMLSVLFSDAHPERRFAAHLGNNDYGPFTEGYFAGLGVVHLAPRGEVDELFASRFKIVSLAHSCEEPILGPRRSVSATWKVECAKAE